MTFLEKFESLKQKYAAAADFSGIDHDLAAEITLTDEDAGGTFYVAWIGKQLSVEPYGYRDNTVSIRIASDLLEALLQGKKHPVDEFLRGSLEAEGEPAHALALIEALKLPKGKEKRKKKTG